MMSIILSASAANITDKSSDKLADNVDNKKITSPSNNPKVAAQKSFDLNIDMGGLIPDEGLLNVMVNGKVVEKVSLNGMMKYNVILDVSSGDTISFELLNTNKYELVNYNASGNSSYSLTFGATSPTPSGNNTTGDNSTYPSPTNSTPPKDSDNNNTTTTSTIKKTTTTSVNDEPENESDKPKQHETANPILLLILAASVIGAGYQIRRNDK